MLQRQRCGRRLPVPPTIQALLATRLDRLEPAERTLFECASGSEFGKDSALRAIAELGGDPAALQALARKELIRPYRSTCSRATTPTGSVTSSSYDATTPSRRKASSCTSASNWISQQLSEFAEIVGYHLEQAHGYRAEPESPRRRSPNVPAGCSGRPGCAAAGAGRRPAASTFCSRRWRTAPEGAARSSCCPPSVCALRRRRPSINAQSVFARCNGSAVAGGDQPAARVGFLAVEACVSGVLDVREREGASRGSNGRWRARGGATSQHRRGLRRLGRRKPSRLDPAAPPWLCSRCGGRERARQRKPPDRIRRPRLATRNGCWGYLPAGAGNPRATTALLSEGATGMAKAFALVVRGRYRAMQGDLAAGRADIEAGRALIREFGADFYVAGSAQEQAQLELESGEPAAAEIAARGIEMYSQLHGNCICRCRNVCSRVPCSSRGGSTRRTVLRACARKAQADDVATQIEWRSVRARVLAAEAIEPRRRRLRGRPSRSGNRRTTSSSTLEHSSRSPQRCRIGRTRRRSASRRRSPLRAQGEPRRGRAHARAPTRTDARAARRTRLGPRAHATDRRKSRRAQRTARSAHPRRGSGARPPGALPSHVVSSTAPSPVTTRS